MCPNSSEVWIFTGCTDPDSSTWVRQWVLKEHDLIVSGIDWHPVTNRIVTCSHDRNAFVWNFDAASKTWKPSVVILRINRAAMDVKWSPDGKKFAVSSSAKTVMVCWYEAANDWWISKQTKKAKSTVLTVAWHPNSQILAASGTDYRCRVYSAFLDEVDRAPDAAQFGALPEFGEIITEFEPTKVRACFDAGVAVGMGGDLPDRSRGVCCRASRCAHSPRFRFHRRRLHSRRCTMQSWINDCAWSPSGRSLAFIGHDSLLHVVTFAADPSTAPSIQVGVSRVLGAILPRAPSWQARIPARLHQCPLRRPHPAPPCPRTPVVRPLLRTATRPHPSAAADGEVLQPARDARVVLERVGRDHGGRAGGGQESGRRQRRQGGRERVRCGARNVRRQDEQGPGDASVGRRPVDQAPVVHHVPTAVQGQG
jgi:hypothetical protein